MQAFWYFEKNKLVFMFFLDEKEDGE